MNQENTRFLRYICLGLSIVFCTSLIFADLLSIKQTQAAMLGLPEPGQLLEISSNGDLPLLKALRMNPENPLDFEFVIDSDSKPDEKQSVELIKYFLAAITIPQDDLWVNLSPYENNRISSENLSHTDMGRDLLAQDYILKQLSSSLTLPDTELGREFWNNNKNDKDASAFSKVWITPDTARVVENGITAVIAESTLKVQSEFDYLAAENDQTRIIEDTRSIDLLLPTITEQVNHGEHFAKLRQIYSALILAQWFKLKFAYTFYENYIDKNKIAGIELDDKQAKEKIWKLYCESFKKGVYSIIQKNSNSVDNKKQKIKYFSGGFKNNLELKVETKESSSVLAQNFDDQDYYSLEFELSSSSVETYGEMQIRYKAEKQELERLFKQDSFVFETKRIAKEYSDGARLALPTLTYKGDKTLALASYIPSVAYAGVELTARISKNGDDIKIELFEANGNLIMTRYAVESKPGRFTLLRKLNAERIKMKNFVEGEETGRKTFYIKAFLERKHKTGGGKYAALFLFTKGNDNSAVVSALDLAYADKDIRVDVIKKPHSTILNVYHKNNGQSYISYFLVEDENGIINLFKKDEVRRRGLREYLVNKSSERYSTKLKVDDKGMLTIYRNDSRKSKQKKDEYFNIILSGLQNFATKDVNVDIQWDGTKFILSVYGDRKRLIVDKVIEKGTDNVWKPTDKEVPYDEIIDKLDGRKKITKFVQQIIAGKKNITIKEEVELSIEEQENQSLNVYGAYFNKELAEFKVDLEKAYNKDKALVELIVDEEGKTICRLLDYENGDVLAQTPVDFADIELYGLNNQQKLNVYGKRLMAGAVVDETFEIEAKTESKHNNRYQLRVFSYPNPIGGKTKIVYMYFAEKLDAKVLVHLENLENDSDYIGQVSLYTGTVNMDNLIATKKIRRQLPTISESGQQTIVEHSGISPRSKMVSKGKSLDRILIEKQRILNDPESLEAEEEIEIPDLDKELLLKQQTNVADNMVFGLDVKDQGAWRKRDHDGSLTVRTFSFVEKGTKKKLRREVNFRRSELQRIELDEFFVRLRLSIDKKRIYGDVYDEKGKLLEAGLTYTQINDTFDEEFVKAKRYKLMRANQSLVLKKQADGIDAEDKGAWRGFKKSDQRLSAGSFAEEVGKHVNVNYKLMDSVAKEFPFVLEPDAELFVKYSLSEDKEKIFLNAYADEECTIRVVKNAEVLSEYLSKKREGQVTKIEKNSPNKLAEIDYSSYTRTIPDEAKIDPKPVIQRNTNSSSNKIKGLGDYINLIAKNNGTFADLLDLLKDKAEFASFSVVDLYREVLRLMKKPLSIEQKQGLVRMKLGEIVEGAFVLEMSRKFNPDGKLKEYIQFFVKSNQNEDKVGFVDYVTVDPQTGDKKYYEIKLGNAYYDILRQLKDRVDPELFGYSDENPDGIKAEQLQMVYLEENQKAILDLIDHDIESVSIDDVVGSSNDETVKQLRQLADKSDNDHNLDYDDIDLMSQLVQLQKYLFLNNAGQVKDNDILNDYKETVALLLDELSDLARKREAGELSKAQLKEEQESILAEIKSFIEEHKKNNPGFDAAYNPETEQYQAKLGLIPSLANFDTENVLVNYDLLLTEVLAAGNKKDDSGEIKFKNIEKLYFYVIDNFINKDKREYFKDVYDMHKENTLSSEKYGLDYLLEFINVQNDILQACLMRDGEPYLDAHVFIKALRAFQRVELFKALDKIEVTGDKISHEKLMDALRNGHYFGESLKLFDIYDGLISPLKKEFPQIFEETYSTDQLIKYKLGSEDVYNILEGQSTVSSAVSALIVKSAKADRTRYDPEIESVKQLYLRITSLVADMHESDRSNKEIILDLAKIYKDLDLKLEQDRENDYYGQMRKELETERIRLERLDSANNLSIGQEIELRDINLKILGLQVMIAGRMLNDRYSNLKGKGARQVAAGTLIGAKGSTVKLANVLRRIFNRQIRGELVNRMLTSGLGGELRRVYELGGYDISRERVDEQNEQVSIRQRKWINVHKHLNSLKTLIKKNKKDQVLKKLRVLWDLYNNKHFKANKQYDSMRTQLSNIVDLLNSTDIENDELQSKINTALENAKNLETHPNRWVFYDVKYESMGDAIRAELHKVDSIVESIDEIIGFKMEIDLYQSMIKEAKKNGLNKSNANKIVSELERLYSWATAGVVFSKRATEVTLKKIKEMVENGKYSELSGALVYVEKILSARQAELESQKAKIEERTLSMMSEARDDDILQSAQKMNDLLHAINYSEIARLAMDLKKRYFKFVYPEYGYQRAVEDLDQILALLQNEGDGSIIEMESELQELIRDLWFDVKHKHEYRIKITQTGFLLGRVAISDKTKPRQFINSSKYRSKLKGIDLEKLFDNPHSELYIEDKAVLKLSSSVSYGGIDLDLADMNVDSSLSAFADIDVDLEDLKGFTFKPSPVRKILSVHDWCINN